ncbi:hypothetical protein [Gordonia sp. NPDC003376]
MSPWAIVAILILVWVVLSVSVAVVLGRMIALRDRKEKPRRPHRGNPTASGGGRSSTHHRGA